MEKIMDLFKLFRQGEALENADAWIKGQVTATMVAGVLLALDNLVAACGYKVPLDPASANDIGLGIIAVVNIVLTIVTHKSVGLPPLYGVDNH
jgi:hypothetical protein